MSGSIISRVVTRASSNDISNMFHYASLVKDSVLSVVNHGIGFGKAVLSNSSSTLSSYGESVGALAVATPITQGIGYVSGVSSVTKVAPYLTQGLVAHPFLGLGLCATAHIYQENGIKGLTDIVSQCKNFSKDVGKIAIGSVAIPYYGIAAIMHNQGESVAQETNNISNDYDLHTYNLTIDNDYSSMCFVDDIQDSGLSGLAPMFGELLG